MSIPLGSVLHFSGQDNDGNTFESVDHLWNEVLEKGVKPDETEAETDVKTKTKSSGNKSASSSDAKTDSAGSPDVKDDSPTARKRARFYQHGAQYWENVEATYDGVLGGFGHLSPLDIDGSRGFLSTIPDLHYQSAIDCGAGVGRVAENLLCPLFQHVDLVEQNPHYVDKARETIHHTSMRHYYTCGLQDFTFTPGEYDVIWIQWVISQLTDQDCVAFLKRCQLGLKPDGYICLKENNSKEGFILDRDDGSVTRSNALFKVLFHKAGLKVVKEKLQAKFPKQLFPVRMWALKPMGKEELEASGKGKKMDGCAAV